MTQMLDRFPVFEANQVLTSGHLNDVFDYLDQQERQTRSLLIGIGIVCGLEMSVGAGPAIALTKGCGVTSEGYLIVQPEDVTFTATRPYVLPDDIDYPPFEDAATQQPYALWELFPDGTPNTTPLGATTGFLADKAMLLFLELKKRGLRNCSPNNCDDKGSEVTATVRPLLIAKADLDRIIAAAEALGSGLTSSDLDTALTARLALPDLQMLRFDVTNTVPVTSNDVYAAFLALFRTGKAAKQLGEALSAAYAAFSPILPDYGSDPFTGFAAAFGFLDSAPTSPAQVRFLQYYADLFDDLLRAYDEFRWRGAELACACCPSPDIFPRHLMIGLTGGTASAVYRQGFLPSPAVGECAAETQELRQLFARLVEMTKRFTNAPVLPALAHSLTDNQIRVTPSALGGRPLGTRAIPYYYRDDGTPPLYRLWNAERTRHRRANQNPGYHADRYQPAAPAFVTDPLRYDLEPADFLRIEGHLGKPYARVLTTLLSLRKSHRLPIDIIALRTGAPEGDAPDDLANQPTVFPDLEALYDALREELLRLLAESARSLYDLPVPNLALNVGTPRLPLLRAYAPRYTYPASSVGAWYEGQLNRLQSIPYIEFDQDGLNPDVMDYIYGQLFGGTTGLPAANFPHGATVYYLSKLSDLLPASLNALDFAGFRNRYEDMVRLLRFFRFQAANRVTNDIGGFAAKEDFIDLCDGLLFGSKLDAFGAVHDEYRRRLAELRKRQFLAPFLADHPGIQHKAGVPIGGTFILVYHGDPAPAANRLEAVRADVAEAPATLSLIEDAPEFSRLLDRIATDDSLSGNSDVDRLVRLFRKRNTGHHAPASTDEAARIIARTVEALEDGAVIADFFLPYRVSCDGPAIQFVLPRAVPTVTISVGCTDPRGVASVTVEATGGEAPYQLSIEGSDYAPLDGPIIMKAGDYQIRLRDAAGAETPARTVHVPPPVTLGAAEYTCGDDGRFTATVTVGGGVPPYSANGAAFEGTSFTTTPAESGSAVEISFADSKGCSISASFTHECPKVCKLPSKGMALRRAWPFWLPDPDPADVYAGAKITFRKFAVQSTESGDTVDITVPDLEAKAADLTPARFPRLVAAWIKRINDLIRDQAGLYDTAHDAQWLALSVDPGTPGLRGLLWIEQFEGLDFAIELLVETSRRVTGKDSFSHIYDSKGARIDKTAFPTRATGGFLIDKCAPDPTRTPLCQDDPGYKLSIKFDGPSSDGKIYLRVETEPDIPNLTYVWEVQSGIPATSNDIQFAPILHGKGVKHVVVTAYDANGCTVSTALGVPFNG